MPDDAKLMTLAELDIETLTCFASRTMSLENFHRMAATIRRLAEFPRTIVAHEAYLREVGLSGIVADATIVLAELEKPDAK